MVQLIAMFNYVFVHFVAIVHFIAIFSYNVYCSVNVIFSNLFFFQVNIALSILNICLNTGKSLIETTVLSKKKNNNK